MGKRRTEVRLIESEYVNKDKSEVTAVYFNYDCSWIIGESGALTVRSKDDSEVIAAFACSKWQYIRQVDEERDSGSFVIK